MSLFFIGLETLLFRALTGLVFVRLAAGLGLGNRVGLSGELGMGLVTLGLPLLLTSIICSFLIFSWRMNKSNLLRYSLKFYVCSICGTDKGMLECFFTISISYPTITLALAA